MKRITLSVLATALVLFFVININKTQTLATKTEISKEKKEAEENPIIKELAFNFDQFFQRKMYSTRTPGAAAVIIQDSTVYLLKGYGRTVNSRSRAEFIDENTVFRLGSVSKGFGSILAAIMDEKGYLDLDEKVQHYIPEFSLRNQSQASEITLKHVLSHTTGISYHAYTNLIESGWEMDDIINRFPNAKLHGEAGQIYSYQNAMYSVAGEVIERQTGKTLEEVFQDEIFNPLNMDNASVTYEGIKNNENHAQPHQFKKYWKPERITKKYYNAIPAGGVNASINDMAEWLQLLLGNRPDVISEASLDEVFTPYVNTQNKRKYLSNWKDVEKSLYGLGWRVVDRKDDTIIYHGGFVNGFKADIAMNREDKLAICILQNCPSSLSTASIPYFLNEYERLKKEAIEKASEGGL